MEKIVEFIENLDKQKMLEILFAIGVIIVFRVLSSLISKLMIKILRPKNKENKDILQNPFYLPLRTIFTFIGIYIALNILKDTFQINAETLAIITKIMKILMILLVAKAFGEGLDEKNGVFVKLKIKSDREIDKSTRNIILRTIKIIIYIVAGFMVISELGYNISGFITGLGLSGVVITLAAQDTAKSLIGGIAIFLDRPFKIGDYIKVDDYEGTVEDIKFRSTSIRTLDNAVLHIPNSEMAISAVINYSEIKKRRYYANLTLELDTELQKVENVKLKIEQMLLKKEYIIQDSIIIRFQEISDNGMNVVVIAYVNKTNYAEFLRVKEQINYEIMLILQSENVELAYNTQTIHVKNES